MTIMEGVSRKKREIFFCSFVIKVGEKTGTTVMVPGICQIGMQQWCALPRKNNFAVHHQNLKREKKR